MPNNIKIEIEQFIDNVKKYIFQGIKINVTDNMTNVQREALKCLTAKVSENKIAIRPADKGGKITVDDMEDYLEDGKKDLKKKDTYMEIKRSREKEIRQILNKKLEESGK